MNKKIKKILKCIQANADGAEGNNARMPGKMRENVMFECDVRMRRKT